MMTCPGSSVSVHFTGAFSHLAQIATQVLQMNERVLVREF